MPNDPILSPGTLIKDMGKLMNIIKSDFTGVIDMGVAGKIAKNSLGK